MSAPGFPGPVHCDEIAYIFGHDNKMLKPADHGLVEESEAMRRTMCKMWTSFAKTGVPSEKWSPVHDLRCQMLQIKGPNDLQMGEDSDGKRRLDFWRTWKAKYQLSINGSKL